MRGWENRNPEARLRGEAVNPTPRNKHKLRPLLQSFGVNAAAQSKMAANPVYLAVVGMSEFLAHSLQY